jgi:hypothetical protein
VPSATIGVHQLDLSPDWQRHLHRAVALVTSLVCGGVPGLRLIRSDLTPALKAGTRRGRCRNGASRYKARWCGAGGDHLDLLVNAGRSCADSTARCGWITVRPCATC